MRPLTLAVPKGRILDELAGPFLAAGIDLSPFESTRKLLIDSPDGSYRMLLLRASDVPTYVERGVADVGVSGSDTLREDGADLLEPIDLGIGACRLCVAAPAARVARGYGSGLVRVATKYPNQARQFFRQRGIESIIIKLYGSVELAAISGLADVIVDLVSTGGTLRANALLEMDTICDVSSRLVVNRASFQTRTQEIDALVRGIREAL